MNARPRLHKGSAGAAETVLAVDAPLRRVVAAVGPGSAEIRINVGEGPRHLTRRIEQSRRLGLIQAPDGADEALSVVGDAETTFVRFRVGTLPEAVDGIAASEL